MNNQEQLEHLQRKAQEFAQRQKDGKWPVLTCQSCARAGYCCQSHHHHVGDFCTHCSQNETGPMENWTFGFIPPR